MSASESDETFAARWSRLKRAENRDSAQSSTGDTSASTKVEDDQNSVKVDLSSLPRIEDLLPTSDISAFLQKGVPEELKRLALRKAWALDPAIRDFVEVAENQYNWNAPDGVPGFGELGTGVDLKGLLAQATGALQPDQMATNSRYVASSDPMPSEQLLEQAEIESRDLRDGLPVDRVPSKSDPRSSAVKDKSALQQTHVDDRAITNRRRHGGALPA